LPSSSRVRGSMIINCGYLNLTDESDAFRRNVGSRLPRDTTSHACENLSVAIRNLKWVIAKIISISDLFIKNLKHLK